MKIISVSVKSFGKLKNVSLDFKSGINVIQNNNGFGKTTLSNFIRAMLYGFSKGRGKSDLDAAKYMPWDAEETFGGSMVVEHDGATYRIERTFGRTASKERYSVINVDTAKPLDLNVSAGEYFLGLTVESYDRSAYYPQEAVEISSNDNFEAKLANLVENGADDYDKIQKRLAEYKKSFKLNRGNGGKIFELQNRLGELEREMSNARRTEERANEVNRRLKEIQKEQKATADRQKQIKDRLIAERGKLSQSLLGEEDKRLGTRLAELEEKIARVPKDFEADKAKCDEIDRQIASLKNDVRPKVYPSISWITVSCILIAAGALIFALTFFNVWALVACLVLTALGITGIVFSFRRKGAVTLVAGERDTLITQYFSIAGKYVYADNIGFDELRRALWDKYSEYKSDVRARDELKKSVKQTVNDTDAEEAVRRLDEQAEQLSEKLLDLYNEQGRLKKESETLAVDFVGIEDKILSTQAELAAAEFRYGVACKAESLLEEAKENLSVSYLPSLRTRCQQLINTVTGGSYSVLVDKDFNVSLTEDGITKPVASFSRGIREITYLCFRFALSELLYNGKIPFIIIDDAFVNYDEDNFVRATDLVKEVAKTAQVIYFTCHKRLGNLLGK